MSLVFINKEEIMCQLNNDKKGTLGEGLTVKFEGRAEMDKFLKNHQIDGVS